MRFAFIYHAPVGDVFAAEAFEKQLGTEVTFRAHSGKPSYSGELVAAEVLEAGRSARITLDIPDEAFPDDLKATGPWSIGTDA
jgi:hypothetical protein